MTTPTVFAVGVLAAQAGAACFGAGVLWTMQTLNYPLLGLVGADQVPAYETVHNRRFIAVVGPPLVVSLVAAVIMLVDRPARVSLFVPILGLVLLAAIIGSTIRYGAPAHARLQRGFDAAIHRRLVRTNWVRTGAWTVLAAADVVTLASLAR